MPPKQLESYVCPDCQFEIWRPVAELEVSVLGFYDDARFPGRCILAYRRHSVDFAELHEGKRNKFMQDVVVVARAIKAVTGADRINYAILGNTEPHLHMHLIPRLAAREPLPERPPWEDPRPRFPVASDQAEVLIDSLRRALGLDFSRGRRAEVSQ